MASKVILLSDAKKDFAQLQQKARERIARVIDELAEFPERNTGIRKLKPPFIGFRKRAGDYRILFDFTAGTVFVHGIKNRKDAYK